MLSSRNIQDCSSYTRNTYLGNSHVGKRALFIYGCLLFSRWYYVPDDDTLGGVLPLIAFGMYR